MVLGFVDLSFDFGFLFVRDWFLVFSIFGLVILRVDLGDLVLLAGTVWCWVVIGQNFVGVGALGGFSLFEVGFWNLVTLVLCSDFWLVDWF